ncbi:MAG: hypothetical protein ACJ8F7_05415 [Gemmataceae bacterium]
MTWLRRLGGVVVILFSTVGIVCCAAGVVGIWVGYQKAFQTIQSIWEKLDGGLERVSTANQNVRNAAERARTDLAALRKESAGLDDADRRSALAIRTLIRQRAGPDLDELGGRMATLADTATALTSLLQSFQDAPLGQSSLIDADQLASRADDAKRLSAILRRLDDLAGDGDRKLARDEIDTETSQVELILEKCQAAVEQWRSGLDATRERAAQIKRKIVGWLTLAAIGVTGLVTWIGMGQVSLFAHGVKWCRR